MRAAELVGRQGKQPDGSAKTREVKLVTVWTAEGRDDDGTPVRDAGSVTYSAAIESAATRDTDEVPSEFAQRVTREARRRGFDQAQRRAGRLVEVGTVDEIFRPPSHPYTRALLSAVPRPDSSGSRAVIRLEGAVPSAQHPPSGCRFHTRCPSKVGRICEEVEPPLQRAGERHWIACHIPLETLRREPSALPPTPSGKDRP